MYILSGLHPDERKNTYLVLYQLLVVENNILPLVVHMGLMHRDIGVICNPAVTLLLPVMASI